jgi:hypothetical protein
MNAIAPLRSSLLMTQHLLNGYLSDLSDSDLLVRPVEGANHIAWQIGHLIDVERRLGQQIPGLPEVELPAGFSEKHANKPEAQQSSAGFCSRKEYVDLFNKTREATLTALGKLSDADLERPARGPANVKNLADVALLMCNHCMMHGGQFSVIRRKLGKPVLF